MKKLLIVLSLSTLMLSGCGMFRSGHAWKEAKQENPLQIPPGLNPPSSAAAVTIPPPGNTPAAPQAPAKPASLAGNAASMHLSGDVDTAYERIGLALQRGDLGTVVAQSAARHTYRLSISTKPKLGSSQSFLQKHFSNLNQSKTDSSAGVSDSASGASQDTVSVTLKVTPAKNGGSTVSALGDPQQAEHVISVLNSRLGA